MPRRGGETHPWPTGGMVECLGQFRRQTRRGTKPDLWCRGDIGKVGIAIVRQAIVHCWLFGLSEQDRRMWMGQKSSDRYSSFRSLDLRTKSIWYIST